MRPCTRLCAAIGRRELAFGLAAATALAVWSACAGAASLTVKVAGVDGRPVVGAVVLVHGPSGSRAAAASTFTIDQVNQAFTPDLTVVPVGSTVIFPNSDKVSHQVYSFSPAKRFQLPLYRGTPYPPVAFSKPGIVTLGCNIHDDMIAYVVVTDAGWFGRTSSDGTWTTPKLPAGEIRVEVWHPRMHEATTLVERSLKLDTTAPGTLDVQLARSLRPEPLGHKPRSWSDY